MVLAFWAFAIALYDPWTLRGRFRNLRLGMTRAEVRAVMGRPGDDESSWREYPNYALRLSVDWPKWMEFEAPAWKV
jgi:hypothetical protein